MGNEKCKAENEKLKILNFELWFFAFSFQFLFIFSLCGCSSIVSPFVISGRQGLPYDANLSDSYYKIELKKSGALDVLPIIHKPESELLSQSRSVVASFGQDNDGYKSWFNMVAFDEVRLTAKRKYFFLVDEKIKRLPGRPGRLLMEPKRGLMFDSQMILEKSAVGKRRISENAEQIAQLRQVLKNLRKDIDELGRGVDVPGSGDKMLTISGMLLNQIFGTILYTLDRSPALAGMLGENGGVEFDHINFGRGTIRMVVEDNIATVKIRLGAFIPKKQGHRRSLKRKSEVKGIDSVSNQQKRVGL